MNKLIHTQPDMDSLPGGCLPKHVPPLEGGNLKITNLYDVGGHAFIIKNALSKNDCEQLRTLFELAPVSAPVSVTGFQDGGEHAAYGGVAGSTRTTMFSEKLSESLWNVIKGEFGTRQMTDYDRTDWWQDGGHKYWLPVGCSPMMRFMKYESGGEHYAHYDAGFFYPDGEHRTLMSYVIYLTSNDSGATRFIQDNQGCSLIESQRDHSDWTRRTEENEVITKVLPKEGSILFFDHRLCHDVEQYLGPGPRIIVRGDIIYKKIDYVK